MLLRRSFAAVASVLLLATAGACSSTTKGNVSTTCPDDGGCQPATVFATGILSAILVTSDAVFAGDVAANVYVAEKARSASRLLAKSADTTHEVASFVTTSRGLFWLTTERAASAGAAPTGALVWFPSDATEPVVIDAALSGPRGLAAVGDVVYVAVSGKIVELPAGEMHLRDVLSVSAYALRSHGESLYFHDGLSTISSWRLGDAAPQVLAEHVTVGSPFGLEPGARNDATAPFVVDDSGIYWLQQDATGGKVAHVALVGGTVETPIAIAKDYPKTLAIEDGYIYWTQADSSFLPENTTIHRASKSALTTTDVLLGSVVGDVTGLQATPEGLYVAASPSLTDFDAKTLGFKRYGGPLLIIPRAMLDAR
jgi:hypothetical protein